jgi:hypothetical protein
MTRAEPPCTRRTCPVARLVLIVIVVGGPAVDTYLHLDLPCSYRPIKTGVHLEVVDVSGVNEYRVRP